jgi:hypothetical protein
MKRPIAILFMLLLLLQAIPVLHFFSEHNFYAYVDEDKPEETKLKKKDGKECLTVALTFSSSETLLKLLPANILLALPAPYLESFTPPPNATC